MLKTLNKQLTDYLEVVTATPNRTLYHMGGKAGYYTVEVCTSCEGSMIGYFSIYYHNDEGLWDTWSEVICQKDNQLSLAEDIITCLAEEEQYKCTDGFVYEHYDQSGQVIGYTTNGKEVF